MNNNIYYLILFSILLFSISCKDSSINKTSLPENHDAPDGMVYIPEGILSMGGDNEQAQQNEYPKHKVKIEAFFMDQTEVTNAQFAKFVDATSYVTIAERALDWEEMKKELPLGTPKLPDSLLAPGALVFKGTASEVPLNDPGQWWEWIPGANWKHPKGPESNIDKLMNHPVVHIAWEDAKAYCKWAEKRLPTEAEWEWAARGGAENTIYPWGNDAVSNKPYKANFFQGLFPYHNTVDDGYETTAPVKSFPPNGYQLYDMAGNVWEWCEDWFDYEYYKKKKKNVSKASGPLQAYNPSAPFQAERVFRGGSFLCTDSYCSGYRNARRMGSTPDTGLNHAGFRCVKSITQ